MKENNTTHLTIASAVIHKKGIFLCLYEYREDFWLKLSKSIGWGHFSCVQADRERIKDKNLRASMEKKGGIRYELVEIRSADQTEPSPLFMEADVLFRVEEAYDYIQMEIRRHILE